MSIKSKNRRFEICMMVVTSCFILAGLWAVLAAPGTALAAPPEGKGKGGGGGGGNDPVCFTFLGGGVWSDGLGDYCNNKKGKVEAIMDSNGGVKLRTNTAGHRDPEAGRTFFVDFGRPIDLNGDDPDCGAFLQTTSVLPAGFVNKNENFGLLGVDLRAMEVGETRTDASMAIMVSFLYPGGETGERLTIIYGPENRFGCDSTNSTQVTVKRETETEWTITNRDANGELSQAILHERLTTAGGGSLEEWCRTDLDPLVLPLFTVTVNLQ